MEICNELNIFIVWSSSHELNWTEFITDHRLQRTVSQSVGRLSLLFGLSTTFGLLPFCLAAVGLTWALGKGLHWHSSWLFVWYSWAKFAEDCLLFWQEKFSTEHETVTFILTFWLFIHRFLLWTFLWPPLNLPFHPLLGFVHHFQKIFFWLLYFFFRYFFLTAFLSAFFAAFLEISCQPWDQLALLRFFQ